MFCRKCGEEIMDEAVICPKCGCETGVKSTSDDSNLPKTGTGVWFALLLGLIGLIIGLCLYKPNTVARKTFVKGWGITFAIVFVVEFILLMLV